MAIVENGEGQTKFGSELFQAHFGALSLGQHVIGRLPNGRQIVDQSSRPIKDDVPNHAQSLAAFRFRAIQQSFALLPPPTRRRVEFLAPQLRAAEKVWFGIEPR
jgi:hypothetical protein